MQEEYTASLQIETSVATPLFERHISVGPDFFAVGSVDLVLDLRHITYTPLRPADIVLEYANSSSMISHLLSILSVQPLN